MNIPWYTAGVELLQQQQINGRGSEQAVNGNYCTNEIKGRVLRAANIIASKSVTKRMLQWQPSLYYQIILSLFRVSRDPIQVRPG